MKLRGKKILILGGGHHQVPMVEVARSHGMITLVADADINAYCRTHCDLFIPISFTDVERLSEIVSRQRVDGVTTIGTNQAIYWASMIKKKTGIATRIDPPALIERAIKKNMWRPVLESADVCTPHGVSASSCDELYGKYRDRADLPAILKPGDGSGGKGVFLAETWAEFRAGFDYARSYALSSSIVAEEYIDGIVIGVESLIEGGAVIPIGIADKQMSPLPDFATLGVIAPTRLSPSQQNAVLESNVKAIRALELTSGAAHIDMIVKGDRAFVIDIGCRLAGGPIIFSILKHCYGVCMIEAVLRQAVGDVISVSPAWQGIYRGSRHWPAPSAGVLQQVIFDGGRLDEYGVQYLRFWRHQGDEVVKTHDDTTMLGSFVCEGASYQDVLNRLDGFMRHVTFEIK